MNTETEITIAATGNGAFDPELDNAGKAVFMNREVIAPVLKDVVPEYRNCTIDKIISCIDSDSIKSDPVDDISAAVEIPSSDVRIKPMSTEMNTLTEKLIRYDVRFRALNPQLANGTLRFYLHIDLEIQNNYQPGYPIIKRAVYYAAREISSQLGILTHTTDYNALQKTYSIWICNRNIPEKLKNTVTSYTFTKSDIIGKTDEPEADYDLMTVIIIRRGNNEGKESIFDYLTGVFSSNISKVSQYVNIEHNEKLKEEFDKMSGLGMVYYENGQQYGLKQGIQQGMQQGEDRALLLIRKLSEAGRVSDIARVTTDTAYRNQLMAEFAL